VESASSPDGVAARLARDRPDALICYDDKLALHTIDALRALGVRVPEDLAVVGFDDIPFAAIAHPRLTTVSQSATEMGRVAAGMLCRAIEAGALPPSVTLPVRLVVRESTTLSRGRR
jgi:DNA-binding LacI/PurR family transcriptional regulator